MIGRAKAWQYGGLYGSPSPVIEPTYERLVHQFVLRPVTLTSRIRGLRVRLIVSGVVLSRHDGTRLPSRLARRARRNAYVRIHAQKCCRTGVPGRKPASNASSAMTSRSVHFFYVTQVEHDFLGRGSTSCEVLRQ